MAGQEIRGDFGQSGSPEDAFGPVFHDATNSRHILRCYEHNGKETGLVRGVPTQIHPHVQDQLHVLVACPVFELQRDSIHL
jgi:hypothetical protein